MIEIKPTAFKTKKIGKNKTIKLLIFSKNPPRTDFIKKTYIVLN